MAKFRKCTEKDISILLETDSNSDSDRCYKPRKNKDNSSGADTEPIFEHNKNLCYKPRKNKDNSSDSTDTEPIFEHNENLLLQKNALRKKQASLRLKLRRSTEHSVYKIDTDSEDEKSKKITRSSKRLKKSHDENKMPHKSIRTIKLPKRYSDYDCSSKLYSILQKERINYNKSVSESDTDCVCIEDIPKTNSIKLNSMQTKVKKKTKEQAKKDYSDSDCICIDHIPKTEVIKLNSMPKGNKRTRLSSVEDMVCDNTPTRIIKTRSAKRILLNKESKEDITEKVPLNEKTAINSKTSTRQHALTDTPKKKSKIGRRRIISSDSDTSNKHISTDENENNDENEMTLICKVTEDLSIRTKRKIKNVKNSTVESPTVATIRNGTSTPKSRTPSLKHSALTPSVKMRTGILVKPTTPLQEARVKLHVRAVPKSLPCREKEFNEIYTFLESKLTDERGGCIYISGVPGTGKTATVNEVIKCLKRSVEKNKLKHFDFIEINGMKLSEPKQAYVQIFKQLSGKVLMWEQACNALEKKFNSNAKRPMTLLLVDELDLLCTKRQDVIYNLLDWPAKISAKLVVITIANTMDLPERVLMSRVTSRLGLTRVTFQPYSYKQLQEIIMSRLIDSKIFKSEASQLIARKVSAVSGDARRALDICRRAAEITEKRGGATVSMKDVNEALLEMITNLKVHAIKHCSMMEQIFLQAVCVEVTRIGTEEVCLKNAYKQFESLCSYHGLHSPNMSEILGICARLGNYRLLICDNLRNDIHQRILLNVSKDDVYYAVQKIDVY